MKVYKIAKGTKAVLIYDKEDGSTGHMPFHTRKDLEFFDTVIDPVRVHNDRTGQLLQGTVERQFAIGGCAVFVDFDKPEYRLAVPYNKVEVLA